MLVEVPVAVGVGVDVVEPVGSVGGALVSSVGAVVAAPVGSFAPPVPEVLSPHASNPTSEAAATTKTRERRCVLID